MHVKTGEPQDSRELRAHLHGMWAAVAGGWAQHADYADARGGCHAEPRGRVRALVHEGQQREVVEPVAGLRDGQAGQEAAEAGIAASNVHDGESAPEGPTATSEGSVVLRSRPLISAAGLLTRACRTPPRGARP